MELANDAKNMSLSLFCKEYCLVEVILKIISYLATLVVKKKEKSFINEVNSPHIREAIWGSLNHELIIWLDDHVSNYPLYATRVPMASYLCFPLINIFQFNIPGHSKVCHFALFSFSD